jgi:hypothetical protein
MIGASLLLVLQLVAQSAAAADPQVLLQQLGAARYADREAAARALEQLGREAIPVLQGARDSRDMEIRTRAGALLQKIEGSLLTRPTMVWLNFKDAPLNDVVGAMAQQTGMKISLFPENLPRWKSERLSLQETQPLPFWKAIDRLCAAASLQNYIELHGFSSRSEPTLALTDRITRPVAPVSDHGPFRVSLVGLEFQRHVGFAVVMPSPARGNPGAGERERPGAKPDLAPPQPRAVTSVQCSVQLQVTAEPRLVVTQTGSLQILEARDDQGNSLRADSPGTSLLTRSAGYLGGARSSVVQVRAPLNRPDNPGRTIKVLRGVVPLRITARQPDPLIVPLAAAAGKSFASGDLHVLVHELRADPNTHQRQIELTVRVARSESLPASDDASVSDLDSRLDPHQQSIEVIDTRGQVLPWFQTSMDMESSRITLTMSGRAGVEPRELRYYRLIETDVNVPFSFTDVPMP